MFVSIMGDSISTFDGFVPLGYRVYYTGTNLFNNNMESVYDTWWAKVNQFLHAYLCVNNSYSGSKVTGDEFPSANSAERTASLHTKLHNPDYILVYMGFNDFGDGIAIADHASPDCKKNFYASYLSMLLRLKKNYPQAGIICGTLMKTYIRNKSNWRFPEAFGGVNLDEYNTAIRIAAKTAGVSVADIASLNRKYETLDGSHPTKEGHTTLADAWIYFIKRWRLNEK